MTRPSNDIDLKLLEAARGLVTEKGFSALTVRAVAARARANPGMVHYHFKSKRRFKQRVLESIYDDFFRRFTLAVQGDNAFQRLREALRYLGRYARDHRRAGFTLVQDAMGGDRDSVAFIGKNFPRHLNVIHLLALEAQKEGYLRPAPPPFVLTMVLAGVGFPALLVESFLATKVRRPFGVSFRETEMTLLSDEAIDRRVDAVLRGLGALL